MAAADNILKNFNLFVESVGYAGNIDELQLPNLSLKTEDYRAAGMDASIDIDMGMEKLEASGTLSKIDEGVLAAFGKDTNLTARGALQSLGGTVTPVEVKMTGLVKTQEHSAWKAGDKATLKFTVALSYYKYTQGGRVIHEIDVQNMKRIINGVDQLAEQRSALGM
ncbi:phage major tail tube protein [Opitutaceae bacterium TAV4]|nr:phage major tail tube protein [Opitutaceae bacterium TAV4]RRK00809.1 phage major tail tube protein [Opitutaceae bacterium TAV3]